MAAPRRVFSLESNSVMYDTAPDVGLDGFLAAPSTAIGLDGRRGSLTDAYDSVEMVKAQGNAGDGMYVEPKRSDGAAPIYAVLGGVDGIHARAPVANVYATVDGDRPPSSTGLRIDRDRADDLEI